jgi:hypothetical protein
MLHEHVSVGAHMVNLPLNNTVILTDMVRWLFLSVIVLNGIDCAAFAVLNVSHN